MALLYLNYFLLMIPLSFVKLIWVVHLILILSWTLIHNVLDRLLILRSLLSFLAKILLRVRSQSFVLLWETLRCAQEGLILAFQLWWEDTKKDLLSFIKERVLFKIKCWKDKFLSQAEKEILLKSVLAVIPSYALSCLQLPNGLCKKITSLFVKFWWGHIEEILRGGINYVNRNSGVT